MNSGESRVLTDLERDLPTSQADVDQLRDLRLTPGSHSFKALQALVDALPTAARRQSRATAAGRPEFKL